MSIRRLVDTMFNALLFGDPFPMGPLGANDQMLIEAIRNNPHLRPVGRGIELVMSPALAREMEEKVAPMRAGMRRMLRSSRKTL